MLVSTESRVPANSCSCFSTDPFMKQYYSEHMAKVKLASLFFFFLTKHLNFAVPWKRSLDIAICFLGEDFFQAVARTYRHPGGPACIQLSSRGRHLPGCRKVRKAAVLGYLCVWWKQSFIWKDTQTMWRQRCPLW